MLENRRLKNRVAELEKELEEKHEILSDISDYLKNLRNTFERNINEAMQNHKK